MWISGLHKRADLLSFPLFFLLLLSPLLRPPGLHFLSLYKKINAFTDHIQSCKLIVTNKWKSDTVQSLFSLVCHGIDSLSIWKFIGVMNNILPKGLLLISVLIKDLDSCSVGLRSGACEGQSLWCRLTFYCIIAK